MADETQQKISTKGSYLVLGFIPDDDPAVTGRPMPEYGVHTPLRSDGYYGERSVRPDSPFSPLGLARSWREKPLHPRERVVVVQIVDDGNGAEEISDEGDAI